MVADNVVGDMEALIQLVAKEVGTAAHCPWCDKALCKSGAGGEDGPWGDAKCGCGGHEWTRPYGAHMQKWRHCVLPKRGPVAGSSKSKSKKPSRKDADGIGLERPVLYRYRQRIVPSSPSKWAREAPATEAVRQAGQQPSAYVVPDAQSEPESAEWDVFSATLEEHAWIQQWMDKLTLVPDELHIGQRLIEGWRDVADMLAVWNGTRNEGKWLLHSKWARAARRRVFARNWRTYHLRTALAVTMSEHTFDEMLPAMVVVLGRSITQLVHYMKHNPDVGPPTTMEVPAGPLAAVYAQLSACYLAAAVWFMATLELPAELGRKLHVHALWQLLRALVCPKIAHLTMTAWPHQHRETHACVCKAQLSPCMHGSAICVQVFG